jgi:hypothetical protein
MCLLRRVGVVWCGVVWFGVLARVGSVFALLVVFMCDQINYLMGQVARALLR